MGRRKNADQEAEIGHNSELSPDEFFDLHRSIQSAVKRKDEAVSKLRTARKHAQEQGLDLKAYDRVMRLVGYTRTELAEELATVKQYAGILKVPVYGDLENVEVKEVDEATLETDAEARGYVAGRAGEGRDKNPWELTTPLGQAWDRGHLRGQKENLPKQK